MTARPVPHSFQSTIGEPVPHRGRDPRPDEQLNQALDSVTADEAFDVLVSALNINHGPVALTHMPDAVTWKRADDHQRAVILGTWLTSELIRVAEERQRTSEFVNIGGTND